MRSSEQENGLFPNFFRWWRILVEYSGLLWRVNLGYLMFAVPAAVFTYLSLTFQTALFLILTALCLLLLGPALMAVYEIGGQAALERPKKEIPRFWQSYRRQLGAGLRLGGILAGMAAFLGAPAWIALHSGNFLILAICLGWGILLASFVPFLSIRYQTLPLAKAVAQGLGDMLRSGLCGLGWGILRTIWWVGCAVFPYLLAPVWLLGVPVMGKMTCLLTLQMAEEMN